MGIESNVAFFSEFSDKLTSCIKNKSLPSITYSEMGFTVTPIPSCPLDRKISLLLSFDNSVTQVIEKVDQRLSDIFGRNKKASMNGEKLEELFEMFRSCKKIEQMISIFRTKIAKDTPAESAEIMKEMALVEAHLAEVTAREEAILIQSLKILYPAPKGAKALKKILSNNSIPLLSACKSEMPEAIIEGLIRNGANAYKVFEKLIQDGNLSTAEKLIPYMTDLAKQPGGGWPLVIFTCQSPLLKEMTLQLIEKADPEQINFQDRDFGRTALFQACYSHQNDVAMALIKKRANVQIPDKNGNTSVTCALKWKDSIESHVASNECRDNTIIGELLSRIPIDQLGDDERIRALKWANTKTQNSLFEKRSNVCVEFDRLHAAGESPYRLISYMTDLAQRAENGWWYVMIACTMGMPEENILQVIERVDRAQINYQGSLGRTALMMACEYGLANVAKALVEKGADTRIPDKEGVTPLMMACTNASDIPLIEALLSKIPVEKLSKDERVCVFEWACENNNNTLALGLIPYMTDLAAQPGGGWPLIISTCEGPELKEITLKLIEKADPAQINFQPAPHGMTALIAACYHEQEDIAKALIEKGADVQLRDANWISALTIALQFNNVTLFRALSPKVPIEQFSDDERILAFKMACKNNLPELLKKLLPYIPKMKIREVLNTPTAAGDTLLIRTCKDGYGTIAEMLIELGANPNIQDHEGHSALYYACESAAVDVVKKLLPLTKELHIEDTHGQTPLSIAVKQRSKEVVNLLLEHYPNIKDAGRNDAAIVTICKNNPVDGAWLLEQFPPHTKDALLRIGFQKDKEGLLAIIRALTIDEVKKFIDPLIKEYPGVLTAQDLFNIAHKPNYAHLAFGWEAIPLKDPSVHVTELTDQFLELNTTDPAAPNYINSIELRALGKERGETLQNLVNLIVAAKSPIKTTEQMETLYSTMRREGTLLETHDLHSLFSFLMEQTGEQAPAEMQKKLKSLAVEGKVDILVWLKDRVGSPERLEGILLLKSFTDKIMKKTIFIGVLNESYAKPFYEAIENAIGNSVQMMRALSPEKKYAVFANMIRELSLCGGKLHYIATSTYFDLKGKKGTFDRLTFTTLASQREAILRSLMPYDDQSVHIYNELLTRVGKELGIPGAAEAVQDPFGSLKGVHLATLSKNFFETYSPTNIVANIRTELHINGAFREKYLEWWKPRSANWGKVVYDQVTSYVRQMEQKEITHKRLIENVEALKNSYPLGSVERSMCEKLLNEQLPYLDTLTVEGLQDLQQSNFLEAEIYESYVPIKLREQTLIQALQEIGIIFPK